MQIREVSFSSHDSLVFSGKVPVVLSLDHHGTIARSPDPSGQARFGQRWLHSSESVRFDTKHLFGALSSFVATKGPDLEAAGFIDHILHQVLSKRAPNSFESQNLEVSYPN
jgi:hypothetical protein